MEYLIQCRWDDEAEVWIAVNQVIPIVLEDESLDRLMRRVREAAPELLELNHLPKMGALYFLIEKREEVCA